MGRQSGRLAGRAAHPRLLRKHLSRQPELVSMPFEFATATRIVFAEGAFREVAPAAAGMGRRALVVTGSTGRRAIDGVPLPIRGEPTVDDIRFGADLARSEGCDVVVAIGGGSAID